MEHEGNVGLYLHDLLQYTSSLSSKSPKVIITYNELHSNLIPTKIDD